jgi:hypothetical protein
MTRQRLIPMATVAAALFALLIAPAPAQARTSAGVIISPHGGLGIWIGRDVDRHGHHGPFRGPMVPGPWPRRFEPVWTPLPRVVVVPPPVPVIEPELATITVWITNSNGSMTSIQLTREGPWYRGPRGEYYTSMPTNEQLRVVYGF